MQIDFTPKLEAKLTQAAVEQGQLPDELVQQIVALYLDEEAPERGDHLIHEQLGDRTADLPVIYRNGVPLLPVQPGSRAVTLGEINRLRDELV